MRNLLLFLLALASFGTLHAQSQRDSIAVYAKVMDSFTHEMLKGVKVEVLRPDSSLVSQHTLIRTIHTAITLTISGTSFEDYFCCVPITSFVFRRKATSRSMPTSTNVI